MVDWWIMDGDIREKFFEVYVPRFKEQNGRLLSLVTVNSLSSLGKLLIISNLGAVNLLAREIDKRTDG